MVFHNRWGQQSNDGGCMFVGWKNWQWIAKWQRETVRMVLDLFAQNEVITQWWGRIRSVPGNNTLPLIISATMQPTDHTSTGGGRLDDREVNMQTKWWEKESTIKSEQDANRVAAVWWCVEMKMENMQPDIWERARRCWVDKTENWHADQTLQPRTARKLQLRHYTAPPPGTKYCIQGKNRAGKDLTVCTAWRTHTL